MARRRLGPGKEGDEWRERYRFFLEACEMRVGLWMRMRGLADPEFEVELSDDPYSIEEPATCTVSWRGAGRELSFWLDANYLLTATASTSRGGPYGLRWFMLELDPTEVPSRAAHEALPDLAIARLDRYAHFVIDYGDAVLADDPDLMARVAERVRGAIAVTDPSAMDFGQLHGSGSHDVPAVAEEPWREDKRRRLREVIDSGSQMFDIGEDPECVAKGWPWSISFAIERQVLLEEGFTRVSTGRTVDCNGVETPLDEWVAPAGWRPGDGERRRAAARQV